MVSFGRFYDFFSVGCTCKVLFHRYTCFSMSFYCVLHCLIAYYVRFLHIFFYPSYILTCPTRCHALCPRAALSFYLWSQSHDPMTIPRMVGRGIQRRSSFFYQKKRSFLWSYRSGCPSTRWALCRNF